MVKTFQQVVMPDYFKEAGFELKDASVDNVYAYESTDENGNVKKYLHIVNLCSMRWPAAIGKWPKLTNTKQYEVDPVVRNQTLKDVTVAIASSGNFTVDQMMSQFDKAARKGVSTEAVILKEEYGVEGFAFVTKTFKKGDTLINYDGTKGDKVLKDQFIVRYEVEEYGPGKD